MICWMTNEPLRPRQKLAIKHTTRTGRTLVKDIQYRLDVNTLHRDQETKELGLNEIGRVQLRTTMPLLCDPYSQEPHHRLVHPHRRGHRRDRRRRDDQLRQLTTLVVVPVATTAAERRGITCTASRTPCVTTHGVLVRTSPGCSGSRRTAVRGPSSGSGRTLSSLSPRRRQLPSRRDPGGPGADARRQGPDRLRHPAAVPDEAARRRRAALPPGPSHERASEDPLRRAGCRGAAPRCTRAQLSRRLPQARARLRTHPLRGHGRLPRRHQDRRDPAGLPPAVARRDRSPDRDHRHPVPDPPSRRHRPPRTRPTTPARAPPGPSRRRGRRRGPRPRRPCGTTPARRQRGPHRTRA